MRNELDRFVDAQRAVYERVCEELRQGRKQGHWMWFIFPQLRGLGSSEMAERYGIESIVEAGAYLAHPVLGPRLREWTALVNATEARPVEEIFGYPDHLKFRSSMTLFGEVETGVFKEALRKFFEGERDQLTLKKIAHF